LSAVYDLATKRRAARSRSLAQLTS